MSDQFVAVAGYVAVHCRVGELGAGANHGFLKGEVRDLSRFCYLHLAHQCRSRHILSQRTQSLTDCLGQHRDHVAMKIDRGAALRQLFCKGFNPCQIGCGVGHGYRQLPSRLCDFGVQGVINIYGTCGVYGDKRKVGEIQSRGIREGVNLLCRADQGVRCFV